MGLSVLTSSTVKTGGKEGVEEPLTDTWAWVTNLRKKEIEDQDNKEEGNRIWFTLRVCWHYSNEFLYEEEN